MPSSCDDGKYDTLAPHCVLIEAKSIKRKRARVYLFRFVQVGEWSAEKVSLQQRFSSLEEQTQEESRRLQQSVTGLLSERQILQDRLVCELFLHLSILTSDVKTLCLCGGDYVNRKILIYSSLTVWFNLTYKSKAAQKLVGGKVCKSADL